MTEQGFVEKLAEIGYNGEELDSLLDVTKKMKIKNPDMTYDELILFAKDVFENTQDESDYFIRLD
jgi:hypothetical protein